MRGARPTTNDSDDNDGDERKNDEYKARCVKERARARERERERGGFNDPSRGGWRRERGYAPRDKNRRTTVDVGRCRRYESRESRVVKKTRFTLKGTNLKG